MKKNTNKLNINKNTVRNMKTDVKAGPIFMSRDNPMINTPVVGINQPVINNG